MSTIQRRCSIKKPTRWYNFDNHQTTEYELYYNGNDMEKVINFLNEGNPISEGEGKHG